MEILRNRSIWLFENIPTELQSTNLISIVNSCRTKFLQYFPVPDRKISKYVLFGDTSVGKTTLKKILTMKNKEPNFKDQDFIECSKGMDEFLNFLKENITEPASFIFSFDASIGILDDDIQTIRTINDNFQSSFVAFVVNKCDLKENIEKDKIKDLIKINFPDLSQGSSKGLGNCVYFLSALEEEENRLTDERHREFERFESYIKGYSYTVPVPHKDILLQIEKDLCSVLQVLKSMIPGCEESNALEFLETYLDTIGNLSAMKLNKLDSIIKEVMDSDRMGCRKGTYIEFISRLCSKINGEIAKFLTTMFNEKTNNLEGIDLKTFFDHEFLKEDEIQKDIFYWFNWGDQTERVRQHFADHCLNTKTQLHAAVSISYRNKVEEFLNHFLKYKYDLEQLMQDFKNLSEK